MTFRRKLINIDVYMSGSSLKLGKIIKRQVDTVCVANTFDISRLATHECKNILYFISDPEMLKNDKKFEVLNVNLNDRRVTLIVPYRFLTYRRFLKLLVRHHKNKIKFYKDELSSYKKNKYVFGHGKYPNLRSVLLDVVLPYVAYEIETNLITIFGVDLDYGTTTYKKYGIVSLKDVHEKIDRREWSKFVFSAFLFYENIFKRHYNISLKIDEDSGLAQILKAYKID